MILFRELFLWVKLPLKASPRRGIKQLPHSWHRIYQNELTLMLIWRAQGAFVVIKVKNTQNAQEAAEDRLLTAPQELGPPWNSVQAILTTSASIFLRPGNISGWRGLLQANSSYTFRKQKVRHADEVLRTPHVHCRSKLAAYYSKNITGFYCFCK